MDRKQRYKSQDVHVTCIVPVHNEAECIGHFIEELDRTLTGLVGKRSLIIVDDGSQDDTVAVVKKIAEKIPLKLIKLSRNFGKEKALSAGLDHVEEGSDVTILIDGDFQHPLTTLKKFLDKWTQGYDMVYGLRENRRSESFVKRLLTRTFYEFMSKLSEVPLPVDAGDFRLMDKKVVSALKTMEERVRFMKGIYAWVGFKTTSVSYQVQKRYAGKSSWSFFSLLDLALTGVTSFSSIPLKFWAVVGSLIAGISLSFALYMVARTLLFGTDVPGYASIIVSVSFFGGIQLLSVGILGEYIARIFQEVKRRPQYIIEEIHNTNG